MIKYEITNAVHQELILSYAQAGRVVPTTIDVVAASLANALGFTDIQEVHDVFKRARDMADVPTQMVLKQAMQNHRAERIPASQAITWNPSLTKSQSDYIYAWWHLHGTRMAWLTDDKARATIESFEADPNNREFVSYQNGWTHVAADNVMKYGTATMRTRL